MKRQIVRSLCASLKTTRFAHVVTAPSVMAGCNSKKLKRVDEMPGPSGVYAWPYIGPAFLFHPFSKFRKDQLHLVFRNLHKKYGKMMKFRSGKSWSVFLFDPAYIEAAMRHEGRFPERPAMPLMETYAEKSGTLPGLSVLKGQAWHDVRKPVQDRTLKPNLVSAYLTSQSQVADDLVATITGHAQQGHDLGKLLFRYTAESTSVFCFNARLGFLDHKGSPLSPKHEKLLSSVSKFLQLVAESLYTFPVFKYYPNKLYRTFASTCDDISAISKIYVDRILDDLTRRSEEGSLDPSEPNLMMSLLSDPRMPRERCLRLMSSFFTVATENVSKSLSSCLWLLAKHQDKQEALHQEIMTHIGHGEVKAKALAHMPYLKACFKEAHRMVFPSPVGSVRIMASDVEIQGYLIPKGTAVHFGHNVLCHSADYFERPESFLPERWLRDDAHPAKNYLQSFIVMPFGFGARNCPGRRFAEQQLHLAAIKLLQKYRISLPDPEEELRVVYNIIATKETPLQLNFHLRTT